MFKHFQCTVRPLTLAFVLSSACSAAMAQTPSSQGIYAQAGLLGVGVGYAYPISDNTVIRADYMTLGSRKKDGLEEGINYKGKVKIGRVGVFADYFPMGGGFRVTGGLTVNDTKVALNSNFDGTTAVTIGNQPITPLATDSFNVSIKFPKITPYVGIGWGHQPKNKGWGFLADLGVSLGKAKVNVFTTLDKAQPGRAAVVTQTEIDRETAELRDGVGKFRFMPQITFGVNYRF